MIVGIINYNDFLLKFKIKTKFLLNIIKVIVLKKFKEILIVFSLGAVIYSLIEILFRGFTHWTMTITGGVAFLLIYIVNFKIKTKSILLRCLWGCFIITSLELIVGLIVNRGLKLDVWDYSQQRYNFLGQICPLFSAIWFVMTIPAILLCKFIKTNLSKKLRK